MTLSTGIVFTPALGHAVTVPSGAAKVTVYATSPGAVEIEARSSDEVTKFEKINVESTADLVTYAVTYSTDKLPQEITVSANGVALAGKIRFTHQQVRGTDREFLTEVALDEADEFKSQRIDWLNVDDWEGWAWYRPRDTWIEASFIAGLSNLAPQRPTHNLLLHAASAHVDPNSVLAVFPASTQEIFLTLSGAREGEAPGVYARARRVKRGGKVKAYVGGKLTVHKGKITAIQGAINTVCEKQGLKKSPFTKDEGESPFDRLGFCTWSSIGENVPLTIDLMDNLVKLLAKDETPIGTFIIDDGWQDIRYDTNGAKKTRGLWDFGTWEVMNAQLSDVVALVKKTLPTVKDVGVWMTLAGYWNSIAPNSPLAKKYEMRTFKLNRDNVPGIAWPAPDEGYDGQQSGTIPNPEDRTYTLPPPHLAYTFWKDYFSSCAAAGVTFVKVDNQAYGSYLDGVEGGEQFVAMWNGMTKAANEVFGENKVIHCMAHYERTFNGDIGMGVPTNGKKIVIRNSDDFGLDRPNVHRDHIIYNILNGMLNSQLCFIPDADMFMTGAQWPEYHAVLRAFFEGPILLADKPGASDLNIVRKLIGRSPANVYETVTAPETIRLLARNAWEPILNAGEGPSIKGTAQFPDANAASIILWNARQDALYKSSDIIFEEDVLDALNEANNSPSEVALWLFNSGKASTAVLHSTGSNPEPDTLLSNPLLSVSLPPEAVEILTIAPFHTVGGIKIAALGLTDKYAGLAAIKNSSVSDNTLSTEVIFDGIFGFLVSSEATDLDKNVDITVDGISQPFTTTVKGGALRLIQLDLTKASSNTGKASWTIAVKAH